MLLAVRWRSRRELERRLRGAGFDAEEVQAALDELQETGLVDDHRFARELVRQHADRRLSGDHAIRSALMRSGVAQDIAEESLPEAAEEQGRAVRLAQSRASRMAGLASDVAYRRLFGLLLRRGYAPDVAREASRRALQEALRSYHLEGID